MTNSLSTKYEFREDLTSSLIKHMLGPSDPFERLNDQPTNIYSIGILYPHESVMDDVQIDQFGQSASPNAQDNQIADDAMSLTNKQYPSTMGLTFAVDGVAGEENTLCIQVSFAQYSQDGKVWLRHPVEIPTIELDLAKEQVLTNSLD